MPVFLDPDATFPVVLDSDLDKPAESRPTFWVKAQSMRGQLTLGDVLDKMHDGEPTTEVLFERACEELSKVVIRWENMGGYECNKESMQEVLSYFELREIIRKTMYEQHLQPEEKKSSE